VAERWQIIDADLWYRDFLDLVENACIHFSDDGFEDFTFGMVTAIFDYRCSKYAVFFIRAGSVEVDPISGGAEIEEDGNLTLTLRFHLGDEGQFKTPKQKSKS
jgi:hypothetical protein